MKLDAFLNSEIGLSFASALARATPPSLGYAIAKSSADWIGSRRNSAVVRAVRANQWVVAGGDISQEALDQTVRNVFQNSARSIYELHHYQQEVDAASRLFLLEPTFRELLERPQYDRRGLVVAGIHMSSFDLAFLLLGRNHIRPMALTIPQPEGGRRREFDLRRKTGVNLVEGNVEGLRRALRYLKQGGVVITGIDRPVPKTQLQPKFFDRPASLPIHHIFLALKAQAPVRVMVSYRHSDGKYHVMTTPPVEMDPFPDREQEMLRNAEKILAIAESFIRQAPQQWSMSLPVWPNTLDQVP